MNNHSFRRVRTTKAKWATRAYWWRLGHEDVRAGRGFPREYETWAEAHQRAYESGRAVAVNITAAKLTLPAWRPGVARPRDLSAIAEIAALRVGDAHLGRRQPDVG